MGFPGGTSRKEPTCQCRRHQRLRFNPWVRKIPWRRAWQLTPVFLPGESHGQRSLEGYSPQGRKESDTTEGLNHRHIDVMLDLYKLYCERSPKPEEMRAFRCIYDLYLDRDRIPTPTPDEVADEQGIDVRTLYRDIDRASERLAALIFGIDGMKKA